ncbi:MAG: hypothetical protein ABIH76_05650 [Candidatus Bathyarchaeota archaeon]
MKHRDEKYRPEKLNKPDRPEKLSNEVVEAIRFINLPKKRRLESVKRHREWQKLLNKDRFFDEVFGK